MHPRTRELLEYLDAQRVVLRDVVNAVPPDRRERPPTPGRWSVAGNVEHLAVVAARIGTLVAGPIAEARADGRLDTATTPILPECRVERALDRTHRVQAPDRIHPSGLAFAAAWASLERGGEAVRAALRGADGLALGELTAPHPIFGPLTFYEWFAFVGAHEARHAAQIRQDYLASHLLT